MKNLRKNIIPVLFFAILMGFILRFSAMAKQYAYLGLSIWFEQMIPSLLPFMIISSMLIKLNLDEILIKPFSGIIKLLYKISDAGAYVLVMGLLCGFPMGAKAAVMEYDEGKISKEEAQFLLSFSNNIGPAYFLSFVYGNIYMGISLLHGIFFLYALPLLYGFILRRTVYRNLSVMPEALSHNKNVSPKKSFLGVLDESINNGLIQISMLGGYMIVCNLLVIIPKTLFYKNPSLCAFFHNILEISGGLLSIKSLNLPLDTAFALAHLSLGFTGISCHLQTFHIMGNTDLSKQKYMLHKLILCSIIGILLYIYCMFVL